MADISSEVRTLVGIGSAKNAKAETEETTLAPLEISKTGPSLTLQAWAANGSLRRADERGLEFRRQLGEETVAAAL